jgi:hypothetical protein
MKRNVYLGLVLGTGFLFAVSAVSAQEAPPPPPDPGVMVVQGPGPGPEMGERIEMLGLEGMHPGKVVTGAPFSAVASSETTQTLADGTHIARTTQTNLYRDSQGRFRKEGTFTGFGPVAASGQSKSFVLIHDPVAGTAYLLEPDSKIARELPHPGKAREFLRGQGPGKLGHKGPNDADTQVQDLGTQTIAGVQAQGKRVTRTIPVGQMGNDKPIVSTFETWYSPDLQIVVMSKRNDPRFGQTTYTVSNIQRTEPAASLFTVPAGYTVQQGGPGRGMRRFGGPGAPPPPAEAPAPPAPAAPSAPGGDNMVDGNGFGFIPSVP